MPNTVAYGFYSLRDVMAERVNNVGIEVVRTAISQTLGEHSRQIDALMSMFVQRTTGSKARFKLPSSGTLQPLDEWGNPKPVQTSGYYELGFPIQGAGTAFGDNRVSRALMTVEQANDAVLDAQDKDTDWLRRHLLTALFDNVSWSYVDPDPNIGTVTVKPLANADTDVYSMSSGTPATDDHYKATASAIADVTNPFPAIYDELNEHPNNVGDTVAFIPTNLRTAVATLAECNTNKPNPNVNYGNAENTLTTDGSRFLSVGHDVIGYLEGSKMWTVEWKNLPSNYIIAMTTGNANKLMKMREYPAAELQGFFAETHSPDGNLNIQRFLRYAGFGVFDRTGAVVQQIGNGTYQIPTGYDAPLNI